MGQLPVIDDRPIRSYTMLSAEEITVSDTPSEWVPVDSPKRTSGVAWSTLSNDADVHTATAPALNVTVIVPSVPLGEGAHATLRTSTSNRSKFTDTTSRPFAPMAPGCTHEAVGGVAKELQNAVVTAPRDTGPKGCPPPPPQSSSSSSSSWSPPHGRAPTSALDGHDDPRVLGPRGALSPSSSSSSSSSPSRPSRSSSSQSSSSSSSPPPDEPDE